MIHRVRVLRGAPQLRLRLMAIGADLAADEGRRRDRRSSAGNVVARVAIQELKRQAGADDDCRRDRGGDDSKPS
jgi:hypothetical protein